MEMERSEDLTWFLCRHKNIANCTRAFQDLKELRDHEVKVHEGGREGSSGPRLSNQVVELKEFLIPLQQYEENDLRKMLTIFSTSESPKKSTIEMKTKAKPGPARFTRLVKDSIQEVHESPSSLNPESIARASPGPNHLSSTAKCNNKYELKALQINLETFGPNDLKKFLNSNPVAVVPISTNGSTKSKLNFPRLRQPKVKINQNRQKTLKRIKVKQKVKFDRKQLNTKKTVLKKTLAKKTLAKKTLAKKTLAKKTLAKKTLVKKTLVKKTLANKKPKFQPPENEMRMKRSCVTESLVKISLAVKTVGCVEGKKEDKDYQDKSQVKTKANITKRLPPQRCGHCEKTFRHHSELLNHIKYDHNKKNSSVPEIDVYHESDEIQEDVQEIEEDENSQFKRHEELVHLKGKVVKTKKTVIHQCRFCNKVYPSHSTKKIHEKTHIEKPFACKHCGDTFVSKYGRNKHEKTHLKNSDSEPKMPSEPSDFPCPFCKQTFDSKTALMVHEKSHKVEMPTANSHCERPFKSKSKKEIHKNSHFIDAKKTYYKCTVCEFKFTTEQSLKIHERRKHTGDLPYICRQCGKAYATMYDKKRHERIHLNLNEAREIEYQCRYCVTKYNTKLALELHERKHTGEQPFACDYCGLTFAYFYLKSLHEKIHVQHSSLPSRPRILRKTNETQSRINNNEESIIIGDVLERGSLNQANTSSTMSQNGSQSVNNSPGLLGLNSIPSPRINSMNNQSTGLGSPGTVPPLIDLEPENPPIVKMEVQNSEVSVIPGIPIYFMEGIVDELEQRQEIPTQLIITVTEGAFMED